MQVLYNLLSKILIFNNIINLKAIGKSIRKIINQIINQAKIWFYRLLNGIEEITDIMTTKIILKLYPKRQQRTRNLFTVIWYHLGWHNFCF